MEQTDIKISEDAHQEPDSKSLSYEAQTPAAATEKQLLQYKAAFSATTFVSACSSQRPLILIPSDTVTLSLCLIAFTGSE